MAIVQVRKRGTSIYICFPAHIVNKVGIKANDFFKFERDVLLPNVFILEKIDNSNEI